MKRLPWEPIFIDSDQKIVACNHEQSFDAAFIRVKYVGRHLQCVYEAMTEDRIDHHHVADKILSFGASMVLTELSPSLVSMNVPFAIRRQFYGSFEQLGDLIYNSLNSEDYYYNRWKSLHGSSGDVTLNKSSIARRLWQWYYSILGPVSDRFKLFGQEFNSNSFNKNS